MKIGENLDMRGNNIENCPSLVKEKTLSYNEYQALSEEEKNDGTTYYVPDMPLSDTYTTYSTEEIVVGKWIDGKPIYRKTVICGALPNATTKNVSHGISDLDYVVNYKGIAKNPTVNYYIPINYTAQTDTISYCFISKDNISIYCAVDRTSYTETYVTLEYTKTTD